jgi:hypothetical protein
MAPRKSWSLGMCNFITKAPMFEGKSHVRNRVRVGQLASKSLVNSLQRKRTM